MTFAFVLLAALSAGAVHGSPSSAPASKRFLPPRTSDSEETSPARSLEWEVGWTPATCQGLQSVLDPENAGECGAAVMEAFEDLLGAAGALLRGQEPEIRPGVVKAIGAIFGASIPFPASMLAQLVFPVLSGMVGDLSAAPEDDSSASYIALQQIFRQSLKSNAARYHALKGEWDWFGNLRNDTIKDQGAMYEAAALSWLLNVQHDLAIDQESFFNADCLQMLQKRRFANISKGKCEDRGLAPISDVAMCEVAAHHLKGLPLDVSANVGRVHDQSFPYGCYWKDIDGHVEPFVNSHPGSAANTAEPGRQLLCTSVPQDAQTHCEEWHQADTWQVSQWHAVLHLVILTDIFKSYPALRETTMKRIADSSAEYILLLTHSFKSSLEKRTAFFEKPQLIESPGGKCFFAPAGRKVMLKEGRDYYHNKAVPQEDHELDEDNDDGKCRGRCDVLSSPRCPFRQERGDGEWYSKYCVNEDDVPAARDCFEEYTEEVVSNFTARFNNTYLSQLRAFHAIALQKLQRAWTHIGEGRCRDTNGAQPAASVYIGEESVAACKSLCESQSACIGVQWLGQYNHCWLYGGDFPGRSNYFQGPTDTRITQVGGHENAAQCWRFTVDL